MLEDLPIWGRVIAIFAIAAFSGLVEYLQQFADQDKRKLFSWITLIIKGLTAGLAGLLTYWLVGKHVEDEGWRAFLVAIAGWGGPRTFDLFWNEVFSATIKKLAQHVDDEEAKQGPKPSGS